MSILEKIEFCFQSAARGISKHKAASLASLLTTSACLLLVGCLVILSWNISHNMAQIQSDDTILAFVDDAVSSSAAKELKPYILQIEGVKEVTFISKEEAYKNYVALYAKDSGHLVPSFFRDRYSIVVAGDASVDVISAAVSEVNGIADIRVDQTISNAFNSIQKTVNIFGFSLGVLLLGISIVIMTNTINLSTLVRKDEIEVQKMMGADDFLVRFPYMLEGCLISCIGGFAAFGLSVAAYMGIGKLIESTGILALVSLVELPEIVVPLLLGLVGLGLIIGVCGSRLSIRKHLEV